MLKKYLVVMAVMVCFMLQVCIAAPLTKDFKQGKVGKGGGESYILNLIPDLTAAQKQQIKDLIKSEQAETKAIKEKYKTQIEKVLTPAQLATMKSAIAAKMTDNMVSRLNKHLNLTQDQQTKIKAIYQKYHGQFKQDGDKQSMMQTMNKINDEIKAVLTPDQKTKFEQMQNKFKDKMKNK